MIRALSSNIHIFNPRRNSLGGIRLLINVYTILLIIIINVGVSTASVQHEWHAKIAAVGKGAPIHRQRLVLMQFKLFCMSVLLLLGCILRKLLTAKKFILDSLNALFLIYIILNDKESEDERSETHLFGMVQAF